MKNTTKIGNTTVAKVLGALAGRDKIVLMPFGEGLRYDLVLDEKGTFVRVQCKTGKLKKGCVVFKNYSVTGAGSRRYDDSVDAYGIYCPQNGKCYFISAKECAGYQTALRVEPAKNGMKKNIRHAERYEI